MKYTVNRVAPLRTAVITGIIYAGISLLIVPFFLIGSFFGEEPSPVFGVVFSVALPFLYALIGFICTLVMCGLYNFIVKYTGGMEIELAGVEPAEPAPWYSEFAEE